MQIAPHSRLTYTGESREESRGIVTQDSYVFPRYCFRSLVLYFIAFSVVNYLMLVKIKTGWKWGGSSEF